MSGGWTAVVRRVIDAGNRTTGKVPKLSFSGRGAKTPEGSEAGHQAWRWWDGVTTACERAVVFPNAVRDRRTAALENGLASTPWLELLCSGVVLAQAASTSTRHKNTSVEEASRGDAFDSFVVWFFFVVVTVKLVAYRQLREFLRRRTNVFDACTSVLILLAWFIRIDHQDPNLHAVHLVRLFRIMVSWT